uniref:Putative succinate dehydrogenase cytochrome b560 subunit n=1 Tax=Rhipicephalus microplus TaxID=6941 RepID=A0A6M2D9Z6_RHIMP
MFCFFFFFFCTNNIWFIVLCTLHKTHTMDILFCTFFVKHETTQTYLFFLFLSFLALSNTVRNNVNIACVGHTESLMYTVMSCGRHFLVFTNLYVYFL